MSNIFVRLLLNTDKFDKSLFQAQKNIKGFALGTKSLFAGAAKLGGYAAAFAGISTSIHSAVTANMQFEKSLSSLRSLTGVSAQELNYFRTEAIRMGMDSTQSASQMVDAFKLIGSQMPELLKNKTALTQTAEAAVVLAEAAEIDVPTAAKALTGSLNQMGASSEQAADYINILAAASQQGSADIPYLNKAIENAGGTASSVGIKFNELVAAIEAIAPKITDAASNGTNLRNIFLTLESAADNNLRPSVVGLSKALENLAAKNYDAVQLTKMFGKESVTAAIALLSERDAFESLRTGIEGTNTAYEQAEINNDNLAGSIGKLQSAWTSFINTMAGSNGILQDVVDDLRDVVNWATRAIIMTKEQRQKYDTDKKYKDAVVINQQEAVKRLNDRISKGASVEDAIDAERQLANRMYPEALKYSVRLEAYERARAEAEKARQKELKYGANVAYKEVKLTREKLANAEALFRISEEEYVMRNAIYDVLQKQKSLLQKEDKKTEIQQGLSLSEIDKLIKEKKDKLSLAVTSTERNSLQKEIKSLELQKAKIELEFTPEGSSDRIDALIELKKKEISIAISDKDRIELSRELDELVKKKRYMELEVKYANNWAIDTRHAQDMADIGETFRKMAQLPKDFNKFKIPDLTKNIKSNEEYADSFLQISQSIGTMTNAFASSSDSIGQWALQSISSIAQMVLQLQSLATAQGVASASALPFPANLGAIATVVATIASIFSSLPKFADGGIVGGSSFYGDKLLARVNSGEMILNKKQQKSLYGMTGGTEITLGVSRIQGSDLYLALSNYLKKTGKKL